MPYLSSLSTGIQWVVQKIAQIVSVHVNALEFTLHVLHLKLLFCCYVSVKSLFQSAGGNFRKCFFLLSEACR